MTWFLKLLSAGATRALCVLPVLAVLNSYGASWYVNRNATGAATGESWENAWNRLSAIDWSRVRAGDNLILSGGSSGEFFQEVLMIGKSGTPESPITIRIGQETGHNGTVTVQGINFGAHDWITVNGARNDAHPAPKNILELRTITNNIGLFCSSTNGSAIYLTGPVGVKLHWVGVAKAERGSQRLAHGIQANVVRRGPTDRNEVKYCWIQNTDDDGIQWIGNDPATHFGHQEISFSIIEWVGDDGIEANHGFSVHDCILGPSRFVNGHPDGIQSGGSFWKIYNNEFHDFFNSWLRLQAMETNHHDIWVYNNLFLSGRYGDPKVAIYNTGIEVVQYAAWLGEVESMTWDGIRICNNTFYGAERLVGGTIAWAKRDERTAAAFVHNVIVTNSIIANNIVVECGRGFGIWWQEWKTSPPWGRGVHYSTEASLRVDHNTLTGSRAPDARRIAYFDKLHPTGEAMARSSTWKNNSPGAARFVDIKQWDFTLAPDDRINRDSGLDLSEYFTYDILNRPRTGTWDRGAFESAP